MRGADSYTENLFSSVKLDDFVPANHPLRPIRTWINEALAGMDGKFSTMYEADIKGGRPSIAPEKLMRAMLLQVLFSIRSECQLIEQITYNPLFRWFVGLSIDDAVWNHSVFSNGCQIAGAKPRGFDSLLRLQPLLCLFGGQAIAAGLDQRGDGALRVTSRGTCTLAGQHEEYVARFGGCTLLNVARRDDAGLCRLHADQPLRRQQDARDMSLARRAEQREEGDQTGCDGCKQNG